MREGTQEALVVQVCRPPSRGLRQPETLIGRRAFGVFLFLRRLRHCPNSYASQVLFGLQKIRPRALDDFQQIIHRRDLFELFGQEPLEKINRDVIVLLLREIDQRIDLLGDVHFLIERKFHRIPRRLEFRFRSIDRRDYHPPPGIDHILDEAERVSLLLLRLLEKMLGQLPQRLGCEMRRDRVILQLRAELVPDLLVNGVDDFLAG